MSLNAFEQLGEKHSNHKHSADGKAERAHQRRLSNIKQEKEQDDQQTQFNLYRKAKRAEIVKLLAEPSIGAEVSALHKLLKKLELTDANRLVEYVSRAAWLTCASEDVRYLVLGMINDAIIRIRVTHGLAPFDDGLNGLIDGEQPCAFQQIRKLLVGV